MTDTHERKPRRPVVVDRRASAAPAQPGAGADAESMEVDLDVDRLRDTIGEAEQRYVRLAADFENFKRRKAQELVDSRRYASEDAARTLLPVLDNLRRAVEHAPEAGTEDFFVNGLHLVVREFEAALERLGVEPVPSVGEPFDPAIHEAISGEESDDVETDMVIAELAPGYRLHDRLLRPAVVRVAHPRRPAPAG
ncbi:MAG: nucleotide exchange factor GrpE [Candidatus Dormibacteraeota bacterium]|nr:nucleotide exchange factor GrpE [Candidatus Dormibacteraeota bacterium]